MTDAGTAPVLFDAELRPHRSLSPRGFGILMLVVGCTAFGVALGFLLAGAWPVFGFMGLDVLLLFLAFRWSYRTGRTVETVSLTEAALTIRRIDHWGAQREWQFQPYWVRLTSDGPEVPGGAITLGSHGRSVRIGAFLTADERQSLHQSLTQALGRLRG